MMIKCSQPGGNPIYINPLRVTHVLPIEGGVNRVYFDAKHYVDIVDNPDVLKIALDFEMARK